MIDKHSAELEALQSRIVQWERGDLRRPEDINARAMSQGFQERIADLELVGQRQAEDLRNSKEVATIKGRTLDMILAEIKETRKGVEKMSTAFTGRLQREPTTVIGRLSIRMNFNLKTFLRRERSSMRLRT